MAIYALDDRVPELGEGVWVADNARVIGKVSLGKRVSVRFNAILRGDKAPITAGNIRTSRTARSCTPTMAFR